MATALKPRQEDLMEGAVPSSSSPPALENGDRLTRSEFERRFDAMPDLKKAELLEGVVYMPSPVRLRHHGEPHANVLGWLTVYRAGTPGVIAADNTSARLDLDNEPQPDALLMIEPQRGGQARISGDDYIEGAPELVVEVASSSVSIDVHLKRHVYRRCGVREYLIWRVLDRQIDWLVLRDGQFVPLEPHAQGHYRSVSFPGLWLEPAALLKGDISAVLELLRQGLATAEHQEFVQRLADRPATS
ncbi:MAG: Uma2 family endonuclease [Isosphaeraceae bacterium]